MFYTSAYGYTIVSSIDSILLLKESTQKLAEFQDRNDPSLSAHGNLEMKGHKHWPR